jgi:hypothetical protein
MLAILSEELPSIFHASASCSKRNASRFPLSFFIAKTVADIFEIASGASSDESKAYFHVPNELPHPRVYACRLVHETTSEAESHAHHYEFQRKRDAKLYVVASYLFIKSPVLK